MPPFLLIIELEVGLKLEAGRRPAEGEQAASLLTDLGRSLIGKKQSELKTDFPAVRTYGVVAVATAATTVVMF